MPNQFHREDQDVEIHEYEVNDDPQEIIREEEILRERERELEDKYREPKPKNKHGWAFFLCSMFVGLGFTATTGNPIGLFAGMGIGFLFFVDPIYHRVMDLFE